MKFVKLKEFAEMTSLPISVLRGMCRDGELPALLRGSTFFIESETALKRLNDAINNKKSPAAFLERIEAMKK